MQFLDTLERVGSERQLGQSSSSPQIETFHWQRNHNDCWNQTNHRHIEEEWQLRKLKENFASDEPGGDGGPGEACNVGPVPPEEALLGRTAAMLGFVQLRWHRHRSSSSGATHHDRPCCRHLVDNKFTPESTSQLGRPTQRQHTEYTACSSELLGIAGVIGGDGRPSRVRGRVWRGGGRRRGPPKWTADGGDKERGNEGTALLFHTPPCSYHVTCHLGFSAATSSATLDCRLWASWAFQFLSEYAPRRKYPSILSIMSPWTCFFSFHKKTSFFFQLFYFILFIMEWCRSWLWGRVHWLWRKNEDS